MELVISAGADCWTVRWSVAGTEAVGLMNTASLTEHHHCQSLSALSCQLPTAASSSALGQDALSTVLCALISPVGQLVVAVVVINLGLDRYHAGARYPILSAAAVPIPIPILEMMSAIA